MRRVAFIPSHRDTESHREKALRFFTPQTPCRRNIHIPLCNTLCPLRLCVRINYRLRVIKIPLCVPLCLCERQKFCGKFGNLENTPYLCTEIFTNQLTRRSRYVYCNPIIRCQQRPGTGETRCATGYWSVYNMLKNQTQSLKLLRMLLTL